MAVKDEFKIERQGRTYVLYAGLLQTAHEQFGKSFTIETEILYLDPVPIIAARFRGNREGDDGQFVMTSGIGTGKRKGDRSGAAADAPIEMAETRAKARALRDATNIGITAFEELGDPEPESRMRSEKAPTSTGIRAGGDQGSEDSRSQPRQQPATSANGNPITKSQEARINFLVGKLKEDDQDLSDALGRLEDKVGQPIDAWTQDEANEQINRLQGFVDQRS